MSYLGEGNQYSGTNFKVKCKFVIKINANYFFDFQRYDIFLAKIQPNQAKSFLKKDNLFYFTEISLNHSFLHNSIEAKKQIE